MGMLPLTILYIIVSLLLTIIFLSNGMEVDEENKDQILQDYCAQSLSVLERISCKVRHLLSDNF